MLAVWNFILDILPSLAATGIGAFGVWAFNRKRKSDKIVNEISGLTNEINNIRQQMINGFQHLSNRIDRVNLDRDKLSHEFNIFTSDHEEIINKADNMIKRAETNIFQSVGSMLANLKNNDDDIPF